MFSVIIYDGKCSSATEIAIDQNVWKNPSVVVYFASHISDRLRFNSLRPSDAYMRL